MVIDDPLWELRREHIATVILSATALVYALVGVITLNYPPNYLALSPVWGVVHIAASAMICSFIIFRKGWISAIAGGLTIGSALFRSGAIFVSIGHETGTVLLSGNEEPLASSFVIAGLTWALIALLLWAVWPLSSFALMEKKRHE